MSKPKKKTSSDKRLTELRQQYEKLLDGYTVLGRERDELAAAQETLVPELQEIREKLKYAKREIQTMNEFRGRTIIQDHETKGYKQALMDTIEMLVGRDDKQAHHLINHISGLEATAHNKIAVLEKIIEKSKRA